MDFWNELTNLDTLYLVDTIPDPLLVLAITVMVSSPKKTNYKEFSKYPNVFQLYMPLWDYDEICILRKHCFPGIQEEIVTEYFKFFTGVPRFIFDNPERHMKAVRDAISVVDLETTIKSISHSDSHQDISHYIIKILPTPDYNDKDIAFLSPEIGDIVINAFLKSQKSELIRFIKLSLDPELGALADYRGFLFEHLIHNVVSQGGLFEIYGPLGSPAECTHQVLIPPCKHIKRVKDFEAPQSDIYYQPISRIYGAVDSWISTVGLFQITTSSDRDINEFEIGKIVSKSEMNKLIFVVPKEIYATFPRIKIVSKKRKRAPERERDLYSIRADDLQQFVMKIDLDSYLL